MKIVVDTNVAISGLLWGGPPNEILKMARLGRLRILACDETIQELRKAIGYEKFRKRLDELEVSADDVYAYFVNLALFVPGPSEMRREVMEFGVSQIDAGTRIELAGYTSDKQQELNKEQFHIGDTRSLDEILCELLRNGYIPSFCTSCYRLGRTGEQFMEFAIPGFIEKFCTPNALLTLQEYLEDYGSAETKKEGAELIRKELESYIHPNKDKLVEKLNKITADANRDLYF